MSVVELIPINKGNRFTLDNSVVTNIGRTPNIGCIDNKISRNHAQLFIKPDGTVWIKPIHRNPIFYKTKTNQIVTLTKDKEYQLYDNDQFGLLPNEYFYRISIKSNDKEIEQTSKENETIASSTVPKSPVEENKISTLENRDEDISQTDNSITSNKVRLLPSWISNSSATTPTTDKSQSKEKLTTTPSVQESTRHKANILAYDDDDDEPKAASTSTTVAHADRLSNSQTSAAGVDASKRERCPYGASCYRKNPIHRLEAIHPDDSDWDTEETDQVKAKPICPYGSECYRKNPDHFEEYSHPKKRSIIIEAKRRIGKRKASEMNDDDDGLPNEYDHNDSFIDDSDSTNNEKESSELDTDDDEWEPPGKSRSSDDELSDNDDRELTRREAADFVQGSTANHTRPVIKKPRVDNDDDD